MSEPVVADDELAEEPVGDDGEAAKAKRRHRVLVDSVVVIGVALLVAFLVRTFVLAHFVVDGPSMLNTLHDGDRVLLYMADWGDSNRPVGHPRWIQSPSTETMGTNQVGIFNALYVISKTSDENPSPRWITWPSAGYFPAQLEPNGRWSFSATRSDDVNLNRATVVVRSGGRKLGIRKYPPTSGYGYQTTLTWDFSKRIVVRAGATRTFRVTIIGIRQRGLVLPAQTYTVRLFHA